MKGSSCSGTCLTHVVFGLTIALLGLGKLLAGPDMWMGIGGDGLSLIGVSADANAVAERLATILGLFVALVELLGGLSFAAKCHKTSGGFAGVLTVVMVVALVWHLKNLSFGPEISGYGYVLGTIKQIALPLLFGTVFATHAMTAGCCNSACAVACEVPAPAPAKKPAPKRKAPAKKKK